MKHEEILRGGKKMKWSIMSLVTADLGVVDMREVEIVEAPTWNEFLKYVKKNYKVVKQDKRSGMIFVR